LHEKFRRGWWNPILPGFALLGLFDDGVFGLTFIRLAAHFFQEPAKHILFMRFDLGTI